MSTRHAATGFIEQVDLLVIGSGAGGLSCAVTAAHLGLKVLVVEKEALIGGTTAWSGGWMWIPRNPLAVAAGIVEDIETPLPYLRHELGLQFDEPRLRAFLEAGPRMVEFSAVKPRFNSLTAMAFQIFMDARLTLPRVGARYALRRLTGSSSASSSIN